MTTWCPCPCGASTDGSCTFRRSGAPASRRHAPFVNCEPEGPTRSSLREAKQSRPVPSLRAKRSNPAFGAPTPEPPWIASSAAPPRNDGVVITGANNGAAVLMRAEALHARSLRAGGALRPSVRAGGAHSLVIARSKAIPGCLRHCERSEAIQPSEQQTPSRPWIASSAAPARNDGAGNDLCHQWTNVSASANVRPAKRAASASRA
jgi:hypothetical protein